MNNNIGVVVLDQIIKNSLLDMLDLYPKFAKNFDSETLFNKINKVAINMDGTNTVKEVLGLLRQYLNDYLVKNNLVSDPYSKTFVDNLTNGFAKVLETRIGHSDDLWDQLENAPRLPKNISHPPSTKVQPLIEDHEHHSILQASKENKMDYNEVLESLVKLANIADDEGEVSLANEIDSVIPSVNLLKTASAIITPPLSTLEGAQSYFIMNSRAFEKAFAIKMKEKGTKASPHDVWFDILEEYQEGLLGNQADFLSKYAEGDSSLIKLAMNLKSDDVYLDAHKQVMKMIMDKIAEKMTNGEEPGVAFYETIYDFSKPDFEDEIKAKVIGIFKKADSNKKLKKKAGIFDAIGNTWNNAFGKGQGGFYDAINPNNQNDSLGKYLGRQTGLSQAYTELNKVIIALRGIEKRLESQIIPVLNSPQGGIKSPEEISQIIAPLYPASARFIQLMQRAGLNPPPIPSILDQKYLAKDGSGNINKDGWALYMTDLKKLTHLFNNATALSIDRSNGINLQKPAARPGPAIEDGHLIETVNQISTPFTIPQSEIDRIIGTPRTRSNTTIFGLVEEYLPQISDAAHVSMVAQTITRRVMKNIQQIIIGLINPPNGRIDARSQQILTKYQDEVLQSLISLINQRLREKGISFQPQGKP